jgi:hypothetical protein
LEIKTGQKVGYTKIMMAPIPSTASARTIAPRLARVSSIAAPIGLYSETLQAADRGHHSDLGLAPMLLGDQEHV